jgi:hypothetical protein
MPAGGVGLKKVVVGLLVLVILGGTFATTFFYLLQDKPSSHNPFADVPLPSITSEQFANYLGVDLSEKDLRGLAEMLATVSFSTETVWPPEDKMPVGLSPEEIMSLTKYLGLGLGNLHENGVNGEGVSVAVIDSPLLLNHEALPENISYVEVDIDNPLSIEPTDQAQAAVSMLTGVAPKVSLYYYAVPQSDNGYLAYAEAMNRMLETQSHLPEEEKIRIVSISTSLNLYSSRDSSGHKEYLDALSKLEESGMIVVHPGSPTFRLTGAGCHPSKDRDVAVNYDIWTWDAAKWKVASRLRESGVSTWSEGREELLKMLTHEPDLDYLTADAINTFIYYLEYQKGTMEFSDWLEFMAPSTVDAIAFPVDYITLAGSKNASAYSYYGSGVTTLLVHYVAGLYALGLQVQPDATVTDLEHAIVNTGTPMEDGRKLVNPQGFIDALATD